MTTNQNTRNIHTYIHTETVPDIVFKMANENSRLLQAKWTVKGTTKDVGQQTGNEMKSSRLVSIIQQNTMNRRVAG